MATILETLQNANFNLKQVNNPFSLHIAKAQLNNAVVLLEKDYSLDASVEDIIGDYDQAEDVPNAKDDNRPV